MESPAHKGRFTSSPMSSHASTTCPQTRLHALLPWNWNALRAHVAAGALAAALTGCVLLGLHGLQSWELRCWGSVVTVGGVVFIGASVDSRIRALNAATGQEIWSDLQEAASDPGSLHP